MGSRSMSRKKKQLPQRKNQVPHKFADDERVLCYEPDLKKARVLYDSKVLETVERTDPNGKIRVEYKIHFFGWNSSWDRYVAEEFVLKDTDENRELQNELKTKADILIQGNLKKGKQNKSLSELSKSNVKSTKGQGGETKNEDDSNSSGSSDSSDQGSSDEEDATAPPARINLSIKLKSILEQDYYNITTRKMLIRIPAEVSVVCAFEEYVKYLGLKEISKVIEQHKACFTAPGAAATSTLSSGATSAASKTVAGSSKANINDVWMEDIARTYRKVRQAQEIVHGLKIIYDHTVYQMLLYEVENEQFKTYKLMMPRIPDANCSHLTSKLPLIASLKGIEASIGEERNIEVVNQPGPSKSSKSTPGCSKTQQQPVKQLRRHTRMMGDASGSSASQQPKVHYDKSLWIKAVNKYTDELRSWQMCPEDCYLQGQPDPSMVYGLIHVLRFFVKLPEILNKMIIPMRKVRIIAHHVNQMIEHIETNYVFSVSRLYILLPRSIYEEDHIRVSASPNEEVQQQPPTVPEPEPDLSQYSTRNHRSLVLTKVKPPLAKVVEVPLSTTAESMEEHQFTIMNSTTLPEGTELEEIVISEETIKPDTSYVLEILEEKGTTRIKVEPISPPLPKPKTSETKKKMPEPIKISPPASPMVRQVRKSAAHAAFKTAHMFASQQSITSRTIAASTALKQASDDEQRLLTHKQSPPPAAASSEGKRATRTSESISSSAPCKSPPAKRGRLEQRTRHRSNRSNTSKTPPRRRGSESPSRNIRETRPLEKTSDQRGDRSKRSSSSGASPPPKQRFSDGDIKQEKSKTEPKRISSPRTSKSGLHSSDVKGVNKTTKSTSPTSTIRLRSKSDERQLRSKGALINALSLPMQPTPSRSSHSGKSEEEKSPRRRESTGSKDHSSSGPITPKSGESTHNLRGFKR